MMNNQKINYIHEAVQYSKYGKVYHRFTATNLQELEIKFQDCWKNTYFTYQPCIVVESNSKYLSKKLLAEAQNYSAYEQNATEFLNAHLNQDIFIQFYIPNQRTFQQYAAICSTEHSDRQTLENERFNADKWYWINIPPMHNERKQKFVAIINESKKTIALVNPENLEVITVERDFFSSSWYYSELEHTEYIKHEAFYIRAYIMNYDFSFAYDLIHGDNYGIY